MQRVTYDFWLKRDFCCSVEEGLPPYVSEKQVLANRHSVIHTPAQPFGRVLSQQLKPRKNNSEVMQLKFEHST
jgi:hypothetical protein